MLKLLNITKDYITGDSCVHALKGVSIEFRQSEFVSILGQSGCGKTTLLNIIGGLDQYTDGDLIINKKSTKQFDDRDWDTYRNHSIGFIFQSYNLIPHQTVLSNVELALTLSGVSKEERRQRAITALETVGLGDQLHKKPNQMSGGQMQRVAIARALVNNPDILLADEPTGALDSETSVQIMELLKEISHEKLVIMVTHNPDLANEYSTRIINLLDGLVVSDSDPYVSPAIEGEEAILVPLTKEEIKAKKKAEKQAKKEEKAKRKEELKSLSAEARAEAISRAKEEKKAEKKAKKEKKLAEKKTSMSFKTALSLSLNNLMTKKGRTFLTSFAGSIGIIGIALILSVSSGVNAYITSVEESTMSSYPLQINESTMDTMSMLGALMKDNSIESPEENTVYSNDVFANIMDSVTNGVSTNNLTAFKKYIEENKVFKDNTTDIKYTYKANLNTYVIQDGNPTEPYKATLNGITGLLQSIGLGEIMGMGEGSNISIGGSAFNELVGDQRYIEDQYDKLYGKYPTKANEVVLIVDKSQQVSDYILYTLGIRNTQDLENYITSRLDDDASNDYTIPAKKYTFDEICGYKFKVLPDSEKYKVDGDKIVPRTQAEINDYLKKNEAMTLEIVGILTPAENSSSTNVIGSIGYTSELMKTIINQSNSNPVITKQKNNTQTNLLTGLPFAGFGADCRYIRAFVSSAMPDMAPIVGTMTDMQILQTIKDAVLTNEDAKKLVTFESEGGVAPYGGYTLDDIYTKIMPAIGEISDKDIQKFAGALYQLSVEGMKDEQGNVLIPGDPTGSNFIKVMNSMLMSYANYTPAQAHTYVLNDLGYVDFSTPSSILIYPKDFEAKETVKNAITEYNETQTDENKISYTDTVAMLMESVTTIVNAISYVLVAFVAISLVVSSIMIGIITYISVLERTKEIGILRAIGASKKDVSRVFNAETLIVGFVAGVLGIVISLLLIIIINIILVGLTGIPELKAVLPWGAAIILVLISMGLTLVAGLFPARMAAKKDPVIALRTE